MYSTGERKNKHNNDNIKMNQTNSKRFVFAEFEHLFAYRRGETIPFANIFRTGKCSVKYNLLVYTQNRKKSAAYKIAERNYLGI